MPSGYKKDGSLAGKVFIKGHKTWNKGIKGVVKGWWQGKKRLNVSGKNHYCYGKKRPEFSGKKHPLWGKKRLEMIGPKNPSWKCGKYKNRSNGYVMIYINNHPLAYHNHILEHRLVMEKMIGRYLKSTEIVHHKNGIKDDNRPENLILTVLNKNWHPCLCPKCGFDFLIK